MRPGTYEGTVLLGEGPIITKIDFFFLLVSIVSRGGFREKSLGGGRGNVTRRPIIDQIDKYILKNREKQKKQGMRAPKIMEGSPSLALGSITKSVHRTNFKKGK